MTDCIYNTPISDEEILIYLDDPSDAALSEHLRLCTACAQRLETWQRVNQKLHQSLYRLECCTPEELGEYHLDLLPAEQKQSVERHLRQCPHCQRELAMTREFLRADSFEAQADKSSLPESIRELIMQLAHPQMQGLVRLRGGRTGPRTYQFEQYRLLLETQPSPKQPEHVLAQGAAVGFEAENWELQFWLEGELTHTEKLDDSGAFRVDGLTPGQYTLALISPDKATVIRIVAVDI